MLLTSYDRMIRYLGTPAQALTDTRGQRQTIVNWITSVSQSIENHLQRSLEKTSRTEYFDALKSHWVQYRVDAFPVDTLTDVYCDDTGQFDGAESEITDCIINAQSSGIILPISPPVLGYKVIRIRYVGGMAVHGTQSVFECDFTGTLTVGNFVSGGTSGAVGIIRVVTATSLTVEVLYDKFSDGETLTEYSEENITTATGNTAEITSVTSRALVGSYPSIVRAAEMQVRYMWKHKDDFELSGTNKDGTNIRNTLRRSLGTVVQPLTDEVMAMLSPYVRIAL